MKSRIISVLLLLGAQTALPAAAAESMPLQKPDALERKTELYYKTVKTLTLETMTKNPIINSLFAMKEFTQQVPALFDIAIAQNSPIEVALLLHFFPHLNLSDRLVSSPYRQGINKPNQPNIPAVLYATFHGYTEIVQFLIKAGCRIDVLAADGSTLAMVALAKNHEPLVKIVVDAFTQKNPGLMKARNRSGETFLSLLSMTPGDVDSERKAEAAGEQSEKKKIVLKKKGSKISPQQKQIMKSIPHDLIDQIQWSDTISEFLDNAEYKTVKQKKIIDKIVANQSFHVPSAFVCAIATNNHSALLLLCKKFAKLMNENLIEKCVDKRLTPLSIATAYKYEEEATILLREGAPIDITVKNGSLLITSLKNEMHSLASLLIDAYLEKKPELLEIHSAADSTALMFAAAAKTPKVLLEKLLDTQRSQPKAKDKSGQTALMYAILNKNFEAIKLLIPVSDLEATRNDGRTALIIACQHDNPETIQLIIDNAPNREAVTKEKLTEGIIYALCARQIKVIKKLIPLVNLNYVDEENGQTILMLAVRARLVDAVKDILSHFKNNIDARDNNRDTALLLAASLNLPDIISHLLSAGADPKIADADGFTALHFVAKNGDVESAKLLIPHVGYQPDTIGLTPLMAACRTGNLNIVKLLAPLNISSELINAKDNIGNTALCDAAEKDYETIVDYLLLIPTLDVFSINLQDVRNRATVRKIKKRQAHIEAQRGTLVQPVVEAPGDVHVLPDLPERIKRLQAKLKRGARLSSDEIEELISLGRRLNHRTRRLIHEALNVYQQQETNTTPESTEQSHEQEEETKESEHTSISLPQQMKLSQSAASAAAPHKSMLPKVTRVAQMAAAYVSEQFLPPKPSEDYQRAQERAHHLMREREQIAVDRLLQRELQLEERLLESPIVFNLETKDDNTVGCAAAAAPKGTVMVGNEFCSLQLNLDHLFEGEIRDNKFKGLHHDYRGEKEKAGTLTRLPGHNAENGCYKVEIQDEIKTFFPCEWTHQDVIDRIIEAYDSNQFTYFGRDPQTRRHIFIGSIENPLIKDLRYNKIKIKIVLNTTGTKIITAFPL